MLENLFIIVINFEKKNYVKGNWVEGICMKNLKMVY